MKYLLPCWGNRLNSTVVGIIGLSSAADSSYENNSSIICSATGDVRAHKRIHIRLDARISCSLAIQDGGECEDFEISIIGTKPSKYVPGS